MGILVESAQPFNRVPYKTNTMDKLSFDTFTKKIYIKAPMEKL